MSMRLLFWLGCLLAGAASKHVIGQLQLDSEYTERYITKFSLQNDVVGLVMCNFSVPGNDAYFDNHPHKVQLSLFDDTEWGKFQKMLKEGSLCADRVAISKQSWMIHPEYYDPSSMKKSIQFSHVIQPSASTQFWYFLLSDCSLEFYPAHPPPMNYKISFLNNGSHLPAHEVGLPTLYTIMTLVLLVFSAVYGYFVKQNVGGVGQLHLIVVLLGVGIVSQLLSLAFEAIHLYVYMKDGFGMRWRHTWLALDFFAEFLQGLSELVVAFVLIALSFGWTISVPKLASSSFQAFYRISGTSFWCFAGMTVVQVTLELLGRGYEDDFNQFHDFEHWPGYLLILFRLGLFGVFLFGVTTTTKRSSDDSTISFFKQLSLFGALWFVTFPVCVFISTMVPPYFRHSFVTGAAIFAQSVSLMLLTKLMLSKGQYYKISSMSQMGTVFGGDSFVSKKIATE